MSQRCSCTSFLYCIQMINVYNGFMLKPPSVHAPGGFWLFPGERMEGMKFGMLMCPDHLQNWIDFSHGLLIFLLLVLFWLNFLENAWEEWPEIWHADVSWPPSQLIWLDFGHGLLILLILAPLWLSETAHIWDLWELSGERLGVNVQGGEEAYFQCFALSSV